MWPAVIYTPGRGRRLGCQNGRPRGARCCNRSVQPAGRRRGRPAARPNRVASAGTHARRGDMQAHHCRLPPPPQQSAARPAQPPRPAGRALTPAVPQVQRAGVVGALLEPNLLDEGKPVGPVDALRPQRVHLAAGGGRRAGACLMAGGEGWRRVPAADREHGSGRPCHACRPAPPRGGAPHLTGFCTRTATSCFSGTSDHSTRSKGV